MPFAFPVKLKLMKLKLMKLINLTWGAARLPPARAKPLAPPDFHGILFIVDI